MNPNRRVGHGTGCQSNGQETVLDSLRLYSVRQELGLIYILQIKYWFDVFPFWMTIIFWAIDWNVNRNATTTTTKTHHDRNNTSWRKWFNLFWLIQSNVNDNHLQQPGGRIYISLNWTQHAERRSLPALNRELNSYLGPCLWINGKLELIHNWWLLR